MNTRALHGNAQRRTVQGIVDDEQIMNEPFSRPSSGRWTMRDSTQAKSPAKANGE
jgi:hypothetical protein